MKSNVPYVGVAWLLAAVGCVLGEAPELSTGFGPLRGVWLWTSRNAEVAGFLGIPYAEPPIGKFRFENPRPWTKKWNMFNATSDGSMCLQKSETNEIIGDENCLYLNVFTPMITKDQPFLIAKKIPVLVFIHGGGFRSGSSNSSLFSPSYLLDHDIILVTMNYRLNVLGFFSTGSELAPGNYGLKDIALALAWVRDNVGAFGGDANSITLAGHDAGAVAAQIIGSRADLLSEGLFHKLITMSGTATSQWSFSSRKNIRDSSMLVATLVGCKLSLDDARDLGSGDDEMEVLAMLEDPSGYSDGEVVDCMKRVKAVDIVDMGDNYAWQRHPTLNFTPTLEAEAKAAVLTVHPEQSLAEGLFPDVPWIIGVTDDEGLWKTTDFLLNSQIKDEFVRDYEQLLVPYLLEMKNTIDNVTAVTEAIENFYFNGDILANFETNITQLVGDALISWPTYNFLEKQISHMKSNIYFYVFAFKGTFSNTFRWGIPFRFGAAHGDDINYLFPYLNKKFADLELFNTHVDKIIIDTMCELWINFIKTGVPSAQLTPKWEPYREKHRYLRLGKDRLTDRELEEDFLPERMAFWSELAKNFSLRIEESRVDEPEGEEEAEIGSSSSSSTIARGALYMCAPFIWLRSNFGL